MVPTLGTNMVPTLGTNMVPNIGNEHGSENVVVGFSPR